MLRLKQVNPEIVKSVKVELILKKKDRYMIGLMCIPGQMGIGASDWGLVIIWYTAEQFNWVSERLAKHGYRPPWTTNFYYTHPHIVDNRFVWNKFHTESFIANAPR